MDEIKKYLPAILSAILMCIVLCIIYPHYQYYIDPDGTAYLTIARRYASGDYLTAVNGYWSPWSCWLTAVLIKGGLAAIPSSVIINTLGAACFLFVSQSFFQKFNIIASLQWVLCATLGLFLCYAVFWQSFDDLWECFFLLGALRIMLLDNFKNRPVLWVAYGMVGTLAYFAKAYSFPFFILNTVVCTYFICINNWSQWLRITIVSVIVMVLFSLPWIWLLHNKYGIWTTATAGPLNMSWYLTGHPHWKAGIHDLLPPVYKDSPSYWEDPWFANGDMPRFWNSPYLFRMQLLRIGYNILKFLMSCIQLSALFPVIGFISAISLGWKFGFLSGRVKILIISCLLFPLGFVLINFEARYLWYMLPLGMLIGGLFVQNRIATIDGKLVKGLVIFLFAASFLVYPVYGMKKMYDTGKEEYAWAQELKKRNIKGSFTSVCPPGIAMQATQRLAYFSGNSFYEVIPNASGNSPDNKEFTDEMQRYNVRFYISAPYTSPGQPALAPLTDKQGIPFPAVDSGYVKGLNVFLVNP